MEYGFIRWLGHASFLLKSKGLNVFIDPFKIPEGTELADVIFITHTHFDHLNLEDIAKISKEGTHFVGPAQAMGKIGSGHKVSVGPGSRGEVLGIKFEAVPAYNVKPERRDFHKRESGWVGFIVEIEGKRIYHAGDTDLIEEMGKIEVDLALLPCGGKYVMGIDEAIRASKIIKAKNFAPMHYKALVGKEGSAELEKKFLGSVKNAIILKDFGGGDYSF